MDEAEWCRKLLNLITNGIKYNKPGGTVTLGCAMLASGMMRFSIVDTGRGIPKDLQPRIFEPFDRLGIEASEDRTFHNQKRVAVR